MCKCLKLMCGLVNKLLCLIHGYKFLNYYLQNSYSYQTSKTILEYELYKKNNKVCSLPLAVC